MARSHFRTTVKDRSGTAIQNALVLLYQQGTTSPVLDAYATAIGGSPVASLTTNTQGEAECWFDTPKTIDINVTDNGNTAFQVAVPDVPLSWAAFTETVEVAPPPGEVIRSSALANFNFPVRFRKQIWADAQHPDFGATPGGTAAANNTALQNWLTACKTENLCGFLPGDDLPYDISTTLNLTQKIGWKLEGIGVGHSDASSPRSRIRWTGAAGGTMLLLQGVRDGLLSGVMLDCNSLAAFGIDYDAVSGGIVSTQNDFERVTIVRATDRGMRIAKSNFQTDLTNFYSCYFFANNIGVSVEDANAVWLEFFGCRWTHNAIGITAAFAGTGGHFNIHGGRFLGNTSHDIQTFATRAFYINAHSEGSNRFLLGHGANAYAGAPVTLAGCAVMTVEAADRIGIQWDTASPLVLMGGHYFSNDPAKSFKFGMSNTRRSTIDAYGAGFDGNPCTEANLPYNGVVRLHSCWQKDAAGTAGTADIGTLDGAIPLFSPSTAIPLSTVTAGAPNFGWGEMAWVKIPSGTALTTGGNPFYAAFYHINGKCRISIPHITSHGGAEAVFLGIDAVDNDAVADQSCKVIVRVSANFTLTSDLVFAIRIRPEPIAYL